MTPFYTDPWLTVYGGDNRVVLKSLPDRSVHCVITSPPYWALRDYGTATWEGGDAACDHSPDRQPRTERARGGLTGSTAYVAAQEPAYRDRCGKCGATRIDRQLGLEPTPEQYVANMVAVFREVRRVLRDDGTLWLNLGDSYAASSNTGGTNSIQGSAKRVGAMTSKGHGIPTGLKPKDLVGIPWRVAFALQADGWYLRSDIIWSKPNPMPESVTDRPTKSHEYLFLLAKSASYYFDADAVREPLNPENVAHHDRYSSRPVVGRGPNPDRNDGGGTTQGGVGYNPAGRNIRSVWTIATQPYPGAHFATFPPKLVEPCILAGTSERGVCPECGAPWRRVVERVGAVKNTDYANESRSVLRQGGKASTTLNGIPATSLTTGWRPTCTHDATPVPATVLDCFGGSGTTAMVAQHLGRRAVLIELNPDYIGQQLRRNAAVPLGLEATA